MLPLKDFQKHKNGLLVYKDWNIRDLDTESCILLLLLLVQYDAKIDLIGSACIVPFFPTAILYKNAKVFNRPLILKETKEDQHRFIIWPLKQTCVL